ncbi:MAG: CRISPR-associated endonuclease Cas2 [Epulopiscium sp. Nuni2H_MBin001]|nr:MAG: CRISPR-associated endonuclease Cas2 [Epulopiscium sp. Nuni2H_MBin001]
MTILLMYDVTLAKHRSKVVKLCEAEGLGRLQKSVFVGQVKRDDLDVFKRKLSSSINSDSVSVA